MAKTEREAVKKAIREYTANATKTPSAARDALVRAGIYQRDGKLSPNYKPRKKAS